MATFEQEDLWREAKAFACSVAFMEVLRRLEQREIDALLSSELGEFDKREEAFNAVRAVRALRDELAALAKEPDIVAFNRRLKGDR